MSLVQHDVIPGVIHEVWSGDLTANEIYRSQDAFLKRMEQEKLPLYVIVVELQKNTHLPPISTFINASKRFPGKKVAYHIVVTSMFNEKMVDIVGRFTPFGLKLYANVESAIEAAKAKVMQASSLAS